MDSSTVSPRVSVPEPDSAIVRLWLRPVRDLLPVLADTKDKPLGQITAKEAVTWAVVLGYLGVTGLAAGMMLGNAAAILLGVRR